MSYCKTCRLTAVRDSGQAPPWDCIYRTTYWDVVHAYNTTLAGWLVLVARRHVAAVAELTPEEAAELGTLMRRVSLALKEVTGCQKTYVVQFAEHPEHPHVHVHVIPRLAILPEEKRGPGIFAYLGVPEEERVSETVMNGIAEQVRHVLESMEIGYSL